MGVQGLWRLIESTGTTVPLESLENKVLAIDVSIWIHQAIKGFQDARGHQVANAHLLSLYHRICKLLYFKIKPVFVFDGGVPSLKKQIIAKRSQLRTQKLNEAKDIHKQLIKTLLKHSAVNKILSENAKAKISTSSLSLKRKDDDDEDIYKLPPTIEEIHSSEEEDELDEANDSFTTETDTDSSSPIKWDMHTIDEKSVHFKSLPIEMRHDILTELKETRKQSSWNSIHEMPRHGDGFSDYQMRRLLKRHSVQVSLEEVKKEMGGYSLSLNELESILNDQGVITSNKDGARIASDENVRYFLIKDVQKAIEDAQKAQKERDEMNKKEEADRTTEEITESKMDKENESVEQALRQISTELIEDEEDAELERDLRKAIELSLQDVPSTSQKKENFLNDSQTSHADFESSESEIDDASNTLSAAKNYMMEYSGLSPNEIANILHLSNGKRKEVIETRPNIKKLLPSNVQNEPNLSPPVSPENTNPLQDIDRLESSEVVDESVRSDSGDDDFVEVEDNRQEANVERNNHFIAAGGTSKESKKDKEKDKALEILINPNENFNGGDDMFADIFNVKESSKPSKNDSSVSNNEIIESNVHLPVEVAGPSDESETKNDSNREELANVLPVEEKQIATIDDLRLVSDQLERNRDELIVEREIRQRLGNNITDRMYQEAQELLELFGIPYVVAPMEAESQCAYLDAIDLTDGTITDDSDIWLFGGKTVYKDFFNNNKNVKEFQMANIERIFKLSREQMILFALLVGSDYTSGVQGIGPVTALEVLATFPPIDKQRASISGLEEFRRWLMDGKKVGSGRTALRSKLKNVRLTDNFPNRHVTSAYVEPTIDNSKTGFTWGKPDVYGLIEYANKKFGWKRTKSEEILKPILRRLKDELMQKTLKDYFKVKHKIAASSEDTLMMSKRVKKAIERMGKPDADGNDNESKDEEMKVLVETKSRSRRKAKEIRDEIESKLVSQTDACESLKMKKRPPISKEMSERIPQRDREKADLLRNKMKAIEVFRKSKRGPGYVQKRKKVVQKPKEDAELSESSSSD